jgi:hypothetical protein
LANQAVTPFMEAVGKFSQAVTVFATGAYGTTAQHPEDGGLTIGGLIASTIGALLKGADKFKGYLGWSGLGTGLLADTAAVASSGGLVLAVAGAIKGIVDYTRDSIQDAIHGPGYSAAAEKRLQEGNPFKNGYVQPFLDLIGPPANAATVMPPRGGPRVIDDYGRPVGSGSAAPAPQVTQTNNIHIQGALDDGMIATLIGKITAGLSQAMSHATMDAHPATTSVYTYPGGL